MPTESFLLFLNPVLRPHVDILPSIHTPAVPACWSTGGSFYFPVEELARWLEVYNILLEKVAGL